MRGAPILLVLLLAACHREPDFDERYDKAAKEIEARARTMDADIAEAEKAAAASTGPVAGTLRTSLLTSSPMSTNRAPFSMNVASVQNESLWRRESAVLTRGPTCVVMSPATTTASTPEASMSSAAR